MNDEKIFGPLTLKQFIYAAIGIALVYFAYNHIAGNIKLISSILIVGITFFFIQQANPPEFNEEYIQLKKVELGDEKFKKWIQRKIAMIESQIQARKLKGLADDPSLSKTKELLLSKLS